MTAMTRGTIAIPGTAPDLDAPMESRFGRAALLLLVNADTMEFEAVENPARNASGGAGIEAAELLSRKGVDALVAEKLGPKAEAALSAAGIPLFECKAGISVREALERLKSGTLQSTSESSSGPVEKGEEEHGTEEGAWGGGGGQGMGGGRGMGRGGGRRGRGGGGRGWRRGSE